MGKINKIRLFLICCWFTGVLLGVYLVYRRFFNGPPKYQPIDRRYLTDLHIEDLREGSGAVVTNQSILRAHYTQWLMAGGKVVDSSYKRLVPVEWSMQDTSLLLGLKKGLLGMKKNGKRKIIIPPEFGYGKQAVGVVPPNSYLVYEVEILDIKDKPHSQTTKESFQDRFRR